jgi:hypothetical protein
VALHLIDDAYELVQDDPEASARDEQASRLSLDRAHLDVMQATLDDIANIVEACLPQLPIGAGSFMADQEGRRAVILRTEGRDWLLYWDDGRISLADPFYAHHRPAFYWPVAHGPAFDPEALDTIDRREWRFFQLGISPVGLVCPVCGYPCMDDDTAEVQSCEFCGFALWRLLSGDVPPRDNPCDDKTWDSSLRQLRANFLRWGHSWRPDEPIRISSTRAIEAQPAYRQLVREAMAEWDAWLENPDPAHTPEEVWRRWKRWENEQRQTGARDHA